MIAAGWRYALASIAGTSQRKHDLPCQDASDCRVVQAPDCGPVLVAVASDGAGSAERAEVGAGLACALFVDEIATYYECGGCLNGLTRAFVEDWLTRFNNEVRARAEAECLTPRAFACTLVAAIVEPGLAAFVQIGDGAMVVSRSDEFDEYTWVFWPQRGEYANLTHFATDDNANAHLDFDLVCGKIDEVALFTDGLQGLALHYASQTVHAPFFRPFFGAVRAESDGLSAALSASLAAFLDSEQVNARTDDDKTLILATRRERSGQRAPVERAQE